MRSLNLTLVIVLAGPLPAAPQEGPDLPARVRAIAGELAQVGFPVDIEQVAIEVLPRSEAAADVVLELEALFGGEAGVATWWQLREARGVEVGAEPAEMLGRIAREILLERAVYYQPQRDALVFVEDSLTDTDAHDPQIAHALAVAGRDQVRDLSLLITAPAPTLDQRFALRALLHGEGQAAVFALLALRRPNRAGRRSDHSLDHQLRTGGLPPFEAELWIRGRGLVQRALQSSESRAALEALWEQPPGSTEQASYREKQRDEPATPALPDWPEKAGEAELVYEDTLGEFGAYALLLDGRIMRPKAWLAAVGWDGDRLRRYETAEGESVLVWRIVWDRPADAQQFSLEWAGNTSGHVRVGGRAVDWVLASERGIWNRWLKAFKDTPPGITPARPDAVSTEAIEQDFDDARRANAYLVTNQWRFPVYELTVQVPVGWYEDDFDGLQVVVRTKTAGFRDHIYVIAQPIADGATIEQALEVNRQRLEQDEHLDIELAEVREVDGREVGFLRYRELDTSHHAVYSTTFFFHKDGQVAVTAAVNGPAWDKVDHIIDGVMRGLRFGPVPLADEG